MNKFVTVCVPTDKINPNRLVSIFNYKRQVIGHLIKVTNLSLRPKVIGLFKDENKLIKKVKIELSIKECFYRESIAMK